MTEQDNKPMIVRLAEDFSEDCIKAGYVSTALPSHARLMEAARALPAAAAPSGWLPIDSFPKTLRFGEGENCYSAYALVWNSGMQCPVRAKWWWRTDGDACNFIADGNYAVFPSHWQPLPATPDA